MDKKTVTELIEQFADEHADGLKEKNPAVHKLRVDQTFDICRKFAGWLLQQDIIIVERLPFFREGKLPQAKKGGEK